jgi:hypothetical protein
MLLEAKLAINMIQWHASRVYTFSPVLLCCYASCRNTAGETTDDDDDDDEFSDDADTDQPQMGNAGWRPLPKPTSVPRRLGGSEGSGANNTSRPLQMKGKQGKMPPPPRGAHAPSSSSVNINAANTSVQTRKVGTTHFGAVRVSRQKCTLEDAIGPHACSLQASRRVTNDIPLGRPLFLPVHTVNCVQTLKVHQ